MKAFTVISGRIWSMRTLFSVPPNCFNYLTSHHVCRQYVRWKFIRADANEDLFDLTVEIDGWVLRSLHCCDERWERRTFEFQISILLRGLHGAGRYSGAWECTYSEYGVYHINLYFESLVEEPQRASLCNKDFSAPLLLDIEIIIFLPAQHTGQP